MEVLASCHGQCAAEVFIRGERVMGSAVKGEVLGGGSSAVRKGLVMVKLEKRGLAAADAAFIDVRGAIAVTFEHGAPHGGGNGSYAPAR